MASLFEHKALTYPPKQYQQPHPLKDQQHTTQILPRNPFPFSELLQMLHNKNLWLPTLHEINESFGIQQTETPQSRKIR